MLEIHLSGKIFSSSTPLASLLPAGNLNENLHVILSHNETFPIISSFWTVILHDKRLRALSLIDLQLNENDASLLAQYLHEQSHLQKLTLDSVRGSVEMFDLILQEGVQTNTNINHLTLINIENLPIITIANLIKVNHQIEYLSLKENHISAVDVTLITEALQINRKLKYLDLSSNSIENNGALTLANLFQTRHSSLIWINLIDNYIDDDIQQVILLQCKDLIQIFFSNEIEPFLTSKHSKKSRYPSIIFVTFLFFLWGVPNQLNDVLIRQFMKLFVLSRFEAGLVQSAFYMGYFILAFPAAYVLRHWSYKMGIILGFVLFGTGSFLFWPAALTGQYPPFLLALFVMAAGLASLEVAANPYIANAAGPMETSEKRLNLAQAFNPLGAITGALMGRFFIFSDMDFSPKELEQMRARRTYDDYLKQETLRVVQPYAILGGIAFLWAILIAMVPFPTLTKTNDREEKTQLKQVNQLGRSMFLLSIPAQFVYVGAQVGTWSYFMQYVQDYVDVGEKMSHYLLIGSFAIFALGRLIAVLFMHLGYSPSLLLATCAFSNVLLIILTILCPNSIGVAALFFTSFFMGPMFPTIFALGIKNMDESTTKLASCLLVMACIGGAICPSIMYLIVVETKHLALAFILPGGSYVIVAIFALLAYRLTIKK